MTENLFKHTNIKRENINFLNGKAPDVAAECKRYEELLAAHPIDIQILGIGSNGHIAFNEPGSPFDSRSREVKLTEQTIKDNSRFFKPEEFQPTTAVSMGIASIMSAKKVVLLAKGANKSKAVSDALNGPADPACPASALQTHKDCIFVVDETVEVKWSPHLVVHTAVHILYRALARLGLHGEEDVELRLLLCVNAGSLQMLRLTNALTALLEVVFDVELAERHLL